MRVVVHVRRRHELESAITFGGRVRIASFALVVLVACGNPTGDRAAMFVVTDSAGIDIVQNGEIGALGDGLLQLNEELRLGVTDGPAALQFHRILAIGVDRKGALYIADGGSAEVRVFSAAGDFVRTIGRRGAGPGEFQYIDAVLADSQGIVVVDGRLMRATTFAEDGSRLETIPLQWGTARLLPLRRVRSGWVVSVVPMRGSHIPRDGVVHQDTARVAWLSVLPYDSAQHGDRASTFRDLVTYPRVRLHGFAAAGGFVASTSALWEGQPAHAVDGQGRIHVHQGSRYNIDVIDASGRLVRRIRRPHDPVPITSEMLDGLAARVKTFYDTSSVEYPVGRAADYGRLDLPLPGALPALGRMLVSREGDFWVERPDRVGDPVRLEFPIDGPPESVWDGFAPSGEFLGTVQFPGSFTPRAVTGGQVVGVMKDELGVEFVVRYGVAGWPRDG